MRTIFSIFLVFIGTCLLGQDIITLKTGEELEVVVKQVGLNDVSYVKYDNQKGPTYIILKSDVFMIKYENGTKDVFTEVQTRTGTQSPSENNAPTSASLDKYLSIKQGFWAKKFYEGDTKLTKSQFERKLKRDKEAYAHYADYKTSRILGQSLNGVSYLGGIFTLLFYFNNDQRNALITLISSAVASGVGRFFDSKSKEKLKLALITYNENLENRNRRRN